mgnify:CR=1 FL=1
MHVEELLKLWAIRESRSPHRSAEFIVRNHAEEVRGKSRMVINYKRLNDNTIQDAYNIPNEQDVYIYTIHICMYMYYHLCIYI